jgi:pimeloyl-ACP methyl ester carboxylesterase
MQRTVAILCCLAIVACSDDGESTGTTKGGVTQDGGAGEAAGAAAGSGGSAAKPVKIDRSGLMDVGVGAGLDYAKNELWMCRPDNDPDECARNLDATELKPDGTRAVVKHVPAVNPDFDCFYVYPTVLLSGAAQMTDFTDNGVKIIFDPLLSQGARFSRICKLYAPVYRQTGLSGGRPVAGADSNLALQDVRDAFAYYLKNLNHGRKFVLIGHSQGTFMLTSLMQMDVDDKEDVRKQMLSAVLIGGRITVPAGKAVGGTFKNIPLCAKPGETNCAIAYVSYSADAPPTAGTSLFGGPIGGNEAACVNPATLSGNTGAYAGSYFAVKVENASFTADTAAPSDLETPFALYRNMFKGECVTKGDFHYLEYKLITDKSDPRGIPPWRHTAVDALGFGTHLVDFHIALDDLITAVSMQASAAK